MTKFRSLFFIDFLRPCPVHETQEAAQRGQTGGVPVLPEEIRQGEEPERTHPVATQAGRHEEKVPHLRERIHKHGSLEESHQDARQVFQVLSL